MTHSELFKTTQLGPYTLKNRIVLPPLTRSRSSQPGNIANDLMATYYRQTPGIHSPEQIQGWRKVTDAVHAEGGVIFAQLWHVGRVSHTSLQPGGEAPSAIRADNVKVFIETGPGTGTLADPSTPRALSTKEVKELVELYAQAARNALEAGF